MKLFKIFCTKAILLGAFYLSAGSRMILPEIIYAAPGLESNIYFSNVFNTVAPQNFAYVVKCEAGRQENKRWCWTPSENDVGRKVSLSMEVYDDNGLVDSSSTIVSVAPVIADKTGEITLSLLADSLVNSLYPDHILKLMKERGFTGYTPVGSHSGRGGKPVPGGIAHDGYGGWTWNSFLHCWYYTVAEFKSIQNEAELQQMEALGLWDVPKGHEYRIRTPLMKMVNGKLVNNVQGWLNNINNGRVPDFFVIELGGNDMWQFSRDELQKGLYTKILVDMNELVDELRKIAPKAVIGVTTAPYGCSQDGFGSNYGCKLNSYSYRYNLQAYNKLVMKFVKDRKDPKLSLIPLHQCLDPENSYIRKASPAHARSKREVIRDINALHPTAEGGMQIGDTVCCWLLNQLKQTK